MFEQADLPDTIPVFPLPGALLLPRARLPLNIFEPRYLAMMDDVLKTDHRLIGMVQPRNVPPGKGNAPLQQIGCAGRVTSFSETEDGRYMVTLSGISRYRVIAQNSGFTPYLRADVEWTSFARDLGPTEHDPEFKRPKFMELLARFFFCCRFAIRLGQHERGGRRTAHQLTIHALPFGVEEKQALLESPSLSTRRETLVVLMEFALRSPSQDEGSLQ